MEQKLKEIRNKIDDIDQQLQKLINQRADCALQIAKIKQREKNQIIYRAEREAQILRRIMAQNSGPMEAKDVAEIILLIMAKCRALQHPIKVAYLGPKNSLSHKAAIKHFGPTLQNPANSIKNIFQQVYSEKVNYGVIPIETTETGINNITLENLAEYPLNICGEILLPSSKKQGNDLSRFLIICKNHSINPSGDDKTSLFIMINNQPGALVSVIQPFANSKIDITFLGHRLHRDNIQNNIFFLDIAGHQQDERVKKALAELAQLPLTYTLLGSYPKSIL